MVVPIRLSRLLPYSTQFPLGSFTAKSISLTKLVDAAGVLAGSVHDTITLRSGALAGTVNFQLLESPVLTDSSSTQVVFTARSRSRSPHPSWLLGALSPAPLLEDPYWPDMSCALAAIIPFTRALVGVVCAKLSIKC